MPNSWAMRACFRSVISTIAVRQAEECYLRHLFRATPTGLHIENPLHHGEIFPEILQAVRAAKQCRENRRVGQQDVSGSFILRRHPDKRVELHVACRGKRMRAVEVNGLAREHMDGTGVLRSQRVVGQVEMEVKSANVVQQTELVQVLADRQWSDLPCAFHDSRTESVLIQHPHTERLHQRTGVLTKALLAWYKGVAMVRVFHLALLHVAGETDVVMRR